MTGRILSLLIGYAFGLIQTSYILGRIKGVDIRKKGSGNLGSTNTMRVLGRKTGLLCGTVDILKAVAAALIAHAIFAGWPLYQETGQLFMLYAGLGAILGHDFPVYLGFKGGKGIAAMAGMIVIVDWRIALILVAVFIFTVYGTKYVSVGSLTAMTLFLILWIIFSQVGWESLRADLRPESYLVAAVCTGFSYLQHRSNLSRLAAGTENRIGRKNKTGQEVRS